METTSETPKVGVKCSVMPGWFSDEREISLQLVDGGTVKAPISQTYVRVQQEPTAEKPVEGIVHLLLIDKNDDYVVIELPQPPIARGSRLRIPINLVEPLAHDTE